MGNGSPALQLTVLIVTMRSILEVVVLHDFLRRFWYHEYLWRGGKKGGMVPRFWMTQKGPS